MGQDFSQNSMNDLGGAGNIVYFIYSCLYVKYSKVIMEKLLWVKSQVILTYILFNVSKSILHILNIWVTSVTGSGSYNLITKNFVGRLMHKGIHYSLNQRYYR